MLSLFNTLGRRKEDFNPLVDNHVRMYNCGPTVYDYAHIGNFRTFIFVDILRRYLDYKGFKVTQVMNITDVDDKTIRGAKNEGISLKEYSERYAKAFFNDLNKLRIRKATFYPRATEHIDEIIDLIKDLIEKGYAYENNGSYYFSISKFENYGNFSGIRPDALRRGARISEDTYDKEQAQDFALWKAWEDDDGDNYWITELGKGRPGWHIECSAMSMKFLGKSFDIHTGGVDLIFPHNENEIAQSEASTQTKFVGYWVHAEHLVVDGKKMSKSLGNFYTLREMLKEGHDPLSIRFLLLSSHYRVQLNFTFDGLKQANESVNRLQDFLRRLRDCQATDGYSDDLGNSTKTFEQAFENAMNDDLNMPIALSSLFDFVRETNRWLDNKEMPSRNLTEILTLLERIDTVLDVMVSDEVMLTDELRGLISSRDEARKNKDWKTADRIRDQLYERGLILEDTANGSKLKKRQ